MPSRVLQDQIILVKLADRRAEGHPWRMQRSWAKKCWAAALLTMALAIGGGCRPVAGALAGALERPGKAVRLPDGRAVNMRCSGSGAPTVILEAGFGADSRAWFKVQPTVARTTRTCSYDRAGYGFSDPGPLPRDGAAIARDLDQALVEAGIDGPFIVVGHSAGGLYARLFAARRLSDVAGLVFLDSTVEQLAPEAPLDADGLGGIRKRLQNCLAQSLALAHSPDEQGRPVCASRPQGSGPKSLRDPPEVWRNQLSELDNIFRRTSLETGRVGDLLAAIPAHVISASDTAAAAPRVGLERPLSTWELRHQHLAARFHVASHQTILSSHLVMVDRPDAVIASILELVLATRQGRTPAPLPLSEWTLQPRVAGAGFQNRPEP